jgi:hypothetical protein
MKAKVNPMQVVEVSMEILFYFLISFVKNIRGRGSHCSFVQYSARNSEDNFALKFLKNSHHGRVGSTLACGLEARDFNFRGREENYQVLLFVFSSIWSVKVEHC